MSEVGNIETPQPQQQAVELQVEIVKMADKIKYQLGFVGKQILSAINKYGLEVPGDDDEDSEKGIKCLKDVTYSLHKMTTIVN